MRRSFRRRTLAKRRLYRDKLPDEVVLEVWQRFRDALMPLHSAGKLGAVLFQFPQWFVISRKAYIEECAERLPDFRVAVEFQHTSWMEERNVEETLGFLEEHGLPYVCVDMPQGFDSSLPPIAAATADDLAMVQFHGRDPKAWESKSETASERFRYDYSRDELAEWVPKVRELSGQVGETHVLMNNCYRDFAVRSAEKLGACSTSISPSEAACASGSRGTLVGDGWKRIALEGRDGAGHPALRQHVVVRDRRALRLDPLRGPHPHAGRADRGSDDRRARRDPVLRQRPVARGSTR